MRANTRGRIAEANKPRVTMMRYNIRAQAQAEVQKLVDEAEAKRQSELEAYARVLDETMLYALHTFPKRRFGKKWLREFWDHMYKTRLDARIFFRDGTSAYEEQETGKNIEDLGIRAELAKIGIRMDEWLQEEMVLTDEQEAALRGGKR
jgi:hypothetical protein